MTPERFIELRDKFLIDITTLMQNKNAEYARSDDMLANFKRRAISMQLDPLTILQTDFNKHVDAINSFIIRARPKSGEKQVYLNEPIQQRAQDVVVYMMIFCSILEDLGMDKPPLLSETKDISQGFCCKVHKIWGCKNCLNPDGSIKSFIDTRTP